MKLETKMMKLLEIAKREQRNITKSPRSMTRKLAYEKPDFYKKMLAHSYGDFGAEFIMNYLMERKRINDERNRKSCTRRRNRE